MQFICSITFKFSSNHIGFTKIIWHKNAKFLCLLFNTFVKLNHLLHKESQFHWHKNLKINLTRKFLTLLLDCFCCCFFTFVLFVLVRICQIFNANLYQTLNLKMKGIESQFAQKFNLHPEILWESRWYTL